MNQTPCPAPKSPERILVVVPSRAGIGAGGRRRILRSAHLGLVLVWLLVVVVLPAGAWGGATRLTNTTLNEFHSDVAASGSTVHVVWNTEWQETEWPYRTHREVMYRRTSDGGSTWKPAVTLSGAPLLNQDPVVLASGQAVDVLWVAWRDASDSFGLFRRHSADSGKTWGPIEAIPSGRGAFAFAAALSGTTLHIVYKGTTPTNDLAVYYRSGTDGIGWSFATRLGAADLNTGVDVAAGSGVHVVWSYRPPAAGTDQVYYRRLGGSPSGRITIGPGSGPVVAVSAASVAVAWIESVDSKERVRVRASGDSGDHWGPRRALTSLREEARRPDIAFDGVMLHVVWGELLPPTWSTRAYHRSTSDLGVTWSPRAGIPSAGLSPTIEVAGILRLVDEVGVPAGNSEIFYQTGP